MLSPALQGLIIYKQFILYKRVPSTTMPGKMDKIPLDYTTGRKSNAHDKTNWSDYETIANIVSNSSDDYGVGFVFTDNDPFFFLDIDNCIGADGTWNEFARYAYSKFKHVAIEISQSGKGLHMFGYCGLEPLRHSSKNKQLNAEFYTTARFVALTNNVVGDGTVLGECEDRLPEFINTYFPPAELTVGEEWRDTPVAEWSGPEDDQELIKMARASKSGSNVFGDKASFDDLWTANEEALARNYAPFKETDPFDRSAVDMALAVRAAYWTGKNHKRIWEIMFKCDALRRDKWWPENHSVYLKTTIERAVNKCTNVLTLAATNTPVATDDNESLAQEGVFILPNNNYSIVDAAEIIFAEIAKHKKIFIHGGQPVELSTRNNRHILVPVTPDGFRSRIESYDKKIMSYISLRNGGMALKQKLCTGEVAKALLATEQIRNHLPHIRALLDCSVLSKELKILSKGYHDE